jgi:hypothetical protein
MSSTIPARFTTGRRFVIEYRRDDITAIRANSC